MVEKHSVSEKSAQKLFKSLKKHRADHGQIDGFKAGLIMSKAIVETGFKFPKSLVRYLGKQSDINFYKAFFKNKYSWDVGVFSDSRKREILTRAYFVKTAPGETYDVTSKLNVRVK